MNQHAIGERLAQVRPPSGATPVVAFSPSPAAEVTRIVVCNTTGGNVTFSLYHDDAGSSTFDATTALYYQVGINANTTQVIEAAHPGSGLHVRDGGQIGVESSTGNALTFTLYGVSEDRAQRKAA